MRFYPTRIALALIGMALAGTTAIGKTNDWNASEYSGTRTEKDLRTAMASKGFAWLSGSPADNEKLSIGKNAQFFGFVALRGETGRAANRGALGRAFFAIADPMQREILPKSVLAEHDELQAWWATRETILRLFENHLYTGEPIDKEKATAAGIEFSKLGASVAIHEARGFAALEDSLTDTQIDQLKAWRKDPESAKHSGRKKKVTSEVLDTKQFKQLEDLYAKAFSWITGTPEDNQIIPLGQPAQFFGFVSIRHKSGHAASRGHIAKSFLEILSPEQHAMIDSAIEQQQPVVEQFFVQRNLFLNQLAILRTEPEAFNQERAIKLAAAMGALEAKAGWIEAEAYRKLRETMTDEQTSQMMQLRGDYIVDQDQVETLTLNERGQQLAILCAGCHGAPEQHRPGMIGPTLDDIFKRPIASSKDFEYSDALLKHANGDPWTPETLDQYLAAPKTFAPGTKMEFQGLLNEADRTALIQYLNQTR